MPVHYRACNLCEAMCGVAVDYEGREVRSVRGDPDDPFSQGHLCPKATALKTLYDDPDRLRAPLRKVNGRWEETDWPTALAFAVDGLHRVQQQHGRNAVGLYLGNPTVHNTGAMLFSSLFAKALRTKHRYSATSVDQLPHMLAAYWMFGHQLLLPVPDVDRTDHLLMLGANPIASNGSLMTAPDMKRRLAAVRARGGRVVLFDPRRTETASHATEHHFIRPGTDAWLLLALLHEVFTRGAVRLNHLAPFTDGVDAVQALAARFPPERASVVTGVPADTIRRIAAEFISAKTAVAYGRMGTSTQAFGTLCAWLINVLNVVTGHFDVEGGAQFTSPAFDPRTLPRAIAGGRGSYGRWTSRVRGLPEANGELPVATLAEDILTPGPDQLRAMVISSGNPVLSTPNGAQVERALGQLDFMVSIDLYLNETSRHAQVILPPPSPLERPHYDIAFHLLAVRNTARFAPALFPVDPKAARHDWQIFLELARGLEQRRGAGWGARVKWAALERLGVERLLDLGLRLGRSGQTLGSLRAAPHGVDLGPLRSVLPGAFQKEHQRLQLAPDALVKDVARLEASEAARPALQLINRRHVRDNNSWLHNAPRLVSGPPRCTLLMHPDDAAQRSLQHGQQVTLRSRVGSVVVALEVSDAVMPGVVSLPHGYGHGRPGTRLSVASTVPGVSVNDVSDEALLDQLSGNAALNGVPVSVEAAG